MQIGTPLEERKKAYAGVQMSELVQKYNEAERKRDLPEMLALLDIIKTAPKAPQGPKTTVKDDIMAAAMPAPTPQQGGMDGVLTAMAAQNSPTGQPMMEEQAPQMAANGGTLKLFGGGQGTVAPFSNYSALSVEDLQRMVQMGDPDAERALSERLRANMGYQYKPGPSVAPTPGAGVGPNTPQVTDRFRPSAAPAAQPTAGISAMGPNAGPQMPATTESSSGLRGLFNRFANSPVGKGLGLATKVVGAAELARPTEANVGEDDMLAKMRMLQQRGGELSADARKGAEELALQPKVSLAEWKKKFFPEKAAPAAAGPSERDIAVAPTTVAPTLGFDLSALKPKTTAEYIAEQEAYEKGLAGKGIRSLADIRKDIEGMGKQGAERAAADKTAAQEAFKESALMTLALGAPQFLKGRGLAQATARVAETVTPGLMGAMQTRQAAIKEANKMERDSADKFKLAGLEMEKAQRAEALGNYEKATGRQDKAMQLYADGAIKKYAADMQFHTYMQYGDKAAVTEGIKTIGKELEMLRMQPEFKKLNPEQQQAYIDRLVRDRMNALRSAVGGGTVASRPKITNVPG